MITKELFGYLEDGKAVYNYTLKNENGMVVTITEFGGAIVSMKTPDRFGRMADVVEGYDSLGDYVLGDGYLGALVGRTANRIANAKFTLDGVTYTLAKNNGENNLHGGKIGYSYRLWKVEPMEGEEPALRLTLHSPDGEEGYPGNVDITVIYKLTADNALSILYTATTDKRTPISLTNHAYFNLGGFASGKIFDHILQMEADTYLPTDATLIPTGEIRPVDGTPFDFREPKSIGQDFDIVNNEDMKLAGGYDHCFCFVGGATKEAKLRIVVYEPVSGRLMKVYTNQPAVQLYSGNFLKNPAHPLKGGLPQTTQSAFCLETQTMPDSINQKGFDNVVLNPGEVYRHETVYQFSVNK